MDELSTVAAEVLASKATPANEAGSAPRIEYKRLVQRVDGEHAAAADAELNRWLNLPDDGAGVWDIFQIGDAHPALVRAYRDYTEVQLWQVTVLFRLPAEDKPARSFTDVIAELKDMPGVAGVVIEPVPMPDDTQEITPVVTPTVPQPALAQDTRPTLRDRDFAFLTAPAQGELKH